MNDDDDDDNDKLYGNGTSCTLNETS